jgi:tripartite-type tricarboxylate transporter receptor subunit TctC
MRSRVIWRLARIEFAFALLVLSGTTLAQTGSVTKLIVPFTPGASNDVIGRMIAEGMTKRTGRTWIVENKPGAGSMLGAEFVAKSAADGNTLLLCASANMGILPAIRKSMSYDVERDFAFLARIASSPFALAVNAQLPVSSFAEFVRLAKAKPGMISMGSSGVGALDYLGASLLQFQVGLQLHIIPYKGMSAVLSDLRAGHIDASIVSPATVRPMALDGKVKVLAVLDKQRNELMPSVPSSAELGHSQLLVANWWGIAGPTKMPTVTATVLRQGLMALLSDPVFIGSIKDKGFDPAVLMGDEFSQFVSVDLKSWKDVASRAKIKLDD